jgi:transcriptional regulator with XRE-family HTH domain
LFYAAIEVINMDFGEKLAAARAERKLSQEQVAESVGVSRQAVSKWEAGESLPDIDNLVKLSSLLMVSIDRLLKPEADGCAAPLFERATGRDAETIAFLCKAKRNTYAAHGAEQAPSRPCSHDLKFAEGAFLYIDTYLGGEKFSGEEAVWLGGRPVWAMNYSGRVLDQKFSGDFLKEALLLVPEESPFRGPALHKNGEYSYHCAVNGSFEWFQGSEEIFCGNGKTYECHFHGGAVR